MWEVSGVRHIGIGEEAIVQKGALEDEVGEGVEDVPDVDEAEVYGGRAGKEAEGGSVSGQDEGDG